MAVMEVLKLEGLSLAERRLSPNFVAFGDCRKECPASARIVILTTRGTLASPQLLVSLSVGSGRWVSDISKVIEHVCVPTFGFPRRILCGSVQSEPKSRLDPG